MVSIQRSSNPTELSRVYDYANELYDKIAKRAFSFFELRGFTHGHDLEDWLRAETELLMPVAVELSETETELAVRAEAPGFTEKDVEITLEPDRLVIKGKAEKKVEEKKKKTVYSEISSREIFRSITLPAEIDPDRATATLKDGVLEISMPKAVPAGKPSVMAKAA